MLDKYAGVNLEALLGSLIRGGREDRIVQCLFYWQKRMACEQVTFVSHTVQAVIAW